MSNRDRKLAHPPIVEAVIDIDCDLPPALALPAIEKPARDSFSSVYPKFRVVVLQGGVGIAQKTDVPLKFSVRQGLHGFQFLSEDEKQLVQVRTQGFSFNRLAPYTTLDDYLPEVERTWRLFVQLATPIQIRRVRLRYINRIRLPTVRGQVDLDDYLKVGPTLPDEERLTLVSFVNQTVAVERDTGNQVRTILTSQPEEQDQLPFILDIEASRQEAAEPENWDWIAARIESLRSLNNRVFRDTLTDKCLELFH